MKPLLFLLVFVFYTPFLYKATSQTAPNIQWQKAIGGSEDDVFAGQDTLYSYENSLSAKVRILNNRGNYIVAGTTRSNDFENDSSWRLNQSADIFVGEIDVKQNWIWKRNYGGRSEDEILSIQPANDSGYILIGTTTSNSLDVSGNHGSADIWVVRLGNRGEILWQKCYGGTGLQVAGYIERVERAGYIFTGTSTLVNGDVTVNNGLKDIWVVRIDENGNIRWQKSFGGLNDDLGAVVKVKPGGGFYIGGQTRSKDGLFSGNHSADLGIDMWIGELDNNGNLLRSKCLGGSSHEFLTDLEVSPEGFLYISGVTTSNDGDVSGNHSSAGDAWLVKLNSTFDKVWQKCFGGSNRKSIQEAFEDIEIMTDGSLIAAGITGSDDGDVSYNRGKTDCWISKISKDGTLIWSKTFGGSGIDMATSITSLGDDEFIFLGVVASNDIDVSGNHGLFDTWLVRLGKSNFFTGEVFIDQNFNGLRDPAEAFYTGSKIVAIKTGIDSISTISSTGKFSVNLDTGTYIAKVYPGLLYYNIVPASFVIAHTTYFNKDSIMFALQAIPGKRDLRVDAISLTPSRPGFQTDYQLNYENVGTDEVSVGVIKLVKDGRLNLVSASPMYDAIQGDSIVWNFYNLKPLDKASIAVHFSLSPPPATNVGDSLRSHIYILPSANDLTPQDDSTEIVQLVVGSFDPNDKTEMHAGVFKIRQPSNKEYLNYLVRFQNTGTDTAFNVTIRDTLSSKLDWNTLEMIDASHNYQLDITKGNICQWTFSNILLPDSNRNEPRSHGYLAFRIKPIQGIEHGNKIDNKADIYFDYNLPVTTNTSSTLVKVMIPEQPALNNLKSAYCLPTGSQKIKIANLPSSDYNASVEVKLDGTRLSIASDSSVAISPSALPEGSHTLTVTYTNALATKTGTFNFSVSTIMAPDVNLSANTNAVINLTDPAIITATNVAAGGTAPLFTFARDRLFISIIQAESGSNKANLYARDLSVGENLIYVRMKSNDPCSIAAFADDSIRITRSAVTGITDLDFPTQLINIYPNPFNKEINIGGLSAAKNYVIYIRNLNGQSLYENRIQGRTDIRIEQLNLPAGTYWLSIYDEKKKKLIGSVPVIRK